MIWAIENTVFDADDFGFVDFFDFALYFDFDFDLVFFFLAFAIIISKCNAAADDTDVAAGSWADITYTASLGEPIESPAEFLPKYEYSMYAPCIYRIAAMFPYG